MGLDTVNSRERVRLALEGRKADRPLFCPAIYEHKAGLVGKSPSEVCRDAELLAEAVLAEYETYGPDMLTVGIDIYNVEAEALGSGVLFPEAVDSVPIVNRRALGDLGELDRLSKVDPERAGRMPLVVEAAEAVNDKLGKQVFVRGAVCAPYSMAVELVSIEQLIMAMFDQPNSFDRLLSFCTEVSISYGRAFLDRGVEVCLFDSYAAPPLVSPGLYRDLILPHVRKLITSLKRHGGGFVEYVIGGRTEPIADCLFGTGADILLSDFVSDVGVFLEPAKDTKVLVRRNISPILIEQGVEDELSRHVDSVLELAAKHQNVIVGTGVISYNTSVEKVLKLKSMCFERFDEARCQE